MDNADMAHLESEIWLQSALAIARSGRVRHDAGGDFCTDCGNRIPRSRRRALPHTSLCLGCAEVDERRRRTGQVQDRAG